MEYDTLLTLSIARTKFDFLPSTSLENQLSGAAPLLAPKTLRPCLIITIDNQNAIAPIRITGDSAANATNANPNFIIPSAITWI